MPNSGTPLLDKAVSLLYLKMKGNRVGTVSYHSYELEGLARKQQDRVPSEQQNFQYGRSENSN